MDSNTPRFRTEDFDLTIGGNFTNGGVLTSGDNTIIFNGSNQTLTLNSGSTFEVNNLSFKNATSAAITGTLDIGDAIEVEGTLTVGSGVNLNLNEYSIEIDTGLSNSGTISGSGIVEFSRNSATDIPIGGNNGTFSNLTLRNNNGGFELQGSQTITGALRLASNLTLNIGNHNLTFTENGTVFSGLTGSNEAYDDFSATQYIRMSGSAAAGGVTRTVSGTDGTQVLHFPIGSSEFNPARITVTPNDNSGGTFTVRSVPVQHPSTGSVVDYIEQYWVVSSTGFSSLPNVKYLFQYRNSQAQGTQSNYAAHLISNDFQWLSNSTADVVTSSNVIYYPDNDGSGDGGTTTIIEADFTAGNNFENPTVYFSRASGDWNTVSTWSTDSHEGDPAITIPGSGNPVFIDEAHSVLVDGIPANASSIQIRGILDIGNTGGNLGNLTGQGLLRISSDNLPNADPTGFVSATGGTVEYYRDGGDFTINNAWEIYRNLTISTDGGNAGAITFPATDLLVRDSLKIGTPSNDAALLVNTNSTDDYAISVGQNLFVSGASASNNTTFTLASGSDTELIIEGNLNVFNHATMQVATSGADQTHSVVVGRNAPGTGSLQIDGTLNLSSGGRVADLSLIGNRPSEIRGATTSLNLSSLIIDKVQRDTTVQVNLTETNALTFNGSVDNPGLELQRGTFRINTPQTITLSDGDDFTLNANSRLFNDGGTLQMNGPDGTILILEGVLRLDSGTINIGTGTTNDVAIEYKGAGTSLILVNGGTLNVTGQIRRNPVPTTGALRYRQTGGNVFVGTENVSITNRSVFEVLNSGSEFTMSGGNLYIVRSLGSSSTADLRITPTTPNVTGGTIIFGRDDVDPGDNQNFRINVSASLQNMEIRRNGSRLNTVRPQTNHITLNGNLLINEGTTLNMAASNLNLTIGGNFTNNGTYSAGSNLTTFNGSVQSIIGETIFNRLTVASGTTTLQDDIQVNNIFQVNSAAFLNDNGNELDVRNNVTISGVHQSVSNGAIVFNGINAQTISGGGSLGNVRLENSENVSLGSDLVISGSIEFGSSSGHLAIGSRLLQLTNPGMNIITGAGSNRYILMNGAVSDQGIRKTVPGGLSSVTFTAPIGITGKYTPATFTFSTGTEGGTVRVLPVNQIHPNADGPGDDILEYYWAVFSTIVDLNSITHSYIYDSSDVQGDENNFTAARFNNAEWTVPGGSINIGTNTLTFTNTNLSGAYTAGIASRFEDPPVYFSNASGAFNANIWVDEDNNPLAFPPPSGASVVIRNSHNVTVPSDGVLTSELSITSGGTLDLQETKGHNLGNVNGSGLLRMEPSDQAFPAGNFDTFIEDGGTIEYYSDFDIILPDRSVYSNLELTGNVTKSLAANDIEVRGNLIINEGDFNANSRTITLRGNWLNNSTETAFIPGTGTVILQGSDSQSIGGSEPTTFHNLTISNSQEENSLSRNMTVTGLLNLSDGRLDVGSQTVTIGSSGSLSETASDFLFSSSEDGQITMAPRNVGVSPGNVAGLGFEIVSTEKPLGNNTVITRHFNSRPFAPPPDADSDFTEDPSLRRWFSITSDGITANNSGFDAVVRFYYSPNWDFTGTRITPETMSLYRSTDSGTTWLPVGGNTDVANNRIEAGGIDGFSEWTAFNDDVLPVELTRFEAGAIVSSNGNSVKLEWETATEMENYGFFVMRSQPNPANAENIDYEEIGFIEGAGTIFTRQQYEFVDSGLEQAGTYFYTLVQMDYDGQTETFGPVEVTILPPNEFNLMHNYPNPFNPVTNIPYSIPQEAEVRIEVFNILGQRVQVLVNETKAPGMYTAVFDGSRLASGVYLVRMVSAGHVITNKMLLVK